MLNPREELTRCRANRASLVAAVVPLLFERQSRFAPSDRWRRHIALLHSFRIDEQKEVSDMTRVLDDVGRSTPWRYECPVCGVELSRANFETPQRDYYCPVCTSRQLPRRWSPAHAERELTHEEVAS
jgi:hypothetical protein